MNWLAVEQFVARGQAFMPVNAEGKGDIVKLLFPGGQTYLLDVQARTFLKQILRFFGGDLLSLRKRYGQVIGKKQLIPLPLSRQWTLVPFNMRIPIGRQDRTGWVVAQYVHQIEELSPTVTDIHLEQMKIRVYHSRTFCLQQMRSARLVQAEFEEIHRQPDECREQRWSYDL